MTTRELVDQILALPLEDRVAIAQIVWESVHDEAHTKPLDYEEHERAVWADKNRRAAELDNGTATGCTHEEVMAAESGLPSGPAP